ncbi:alpha/beta fold hydrolase [Nonomuraea spiralis]|uniref:Alpha/beta fold hydrolase n=1 Tax=Nonomuraea spiralis TaxID=46182 RepID=A0ABV5IPF2_9ACTN|nr:alpha/beta hydrolase [Nonomuraea spiralis]
MMRKARRLLAWCAGLVLVAACAGLGYETAARRGDAARFPPPGRLVDVGGHRLHLRCTGSGGPVVVLEAGLVESSASWEVVQRRLSAGLRVCSYDRAGYAWSEQGPGPRTAGRAAAELRALLAAAGEPGPYVLAGHSYGGEIVRLFAARYRDLTAGLVLVDATDEGAAAAMRVSRPLVAAQLTVNQALARIGLLRLAGDLLVPGDATAAARAAAPVVYGPGSMVAARAEAWASLDSAREVADAAREPAGPPVVVVIPSGGPPDALDQARRVAARSTRGRVVVAATSEHYVQYWQPDLVVAAIRETAAFTKR